MRRLRDYNDSEPPHAELLLVMAAELHELDGPAAQRRLEELVARLARLRRTGPLQALAQAAELAQARIAPPAFRPSDGADLMLDRALASGRGQPVIQAVVAVEIGRGVGVPLGVVSDGRRHFVAHREFDQAVVWDFARGPALRAAGELGADLSWHCAHQVAGAVLNTLLGRALHRCDLPGAIKAAELRLDLPFDADTRHHAERELAALRALLN